MTKHLKRPLSVLLAVLMIVSVFAAFPITADAAVKTSGSGSNLTLTLSGNVTLAELTGSIKVNNKTIDKKNIKKITADKNTKFTGNRTASMFTSFPNCTSIDLTNVTFSNWVDASNMFSGLSKLTELKLSTLKLSDANSMFRGCSSLTGIDASVLNARNSNFKSMENMFNGCTKLKSINFGDSFFTGYATSMSNMFKGCSSLETLDISSFDTSKCGTMYYMFSGCTNLKTLTVGDNFKSDSCTAMNHMFAGCSSLESIDVSQFDTKKATTMQGMFDGCSSLTSLDVSGFDTSNVTNMADMFNGCSSLTTIDVSGFDTSNVTLFSDMFNGCSGLTSLDLRGFDTSNATWAEEMFKDCSSLTELDLSSFVENDSAVDNNRYVDLFSGCSALDTVTLSDQFSISEAMKLTNVKDDYTGWANEEDPGTIISGDGEYAAFSGAGRYVRSAGSVEKPIFVSHSLSLDGSIGVNFYLNLTAEEAQNATISFKWFNKELNDAPIALDPNGSGYYKATCPVAVAEMTYDITATLTVGDETYTDVYSTVTYADVILTDESFKTKYIAKTSEEKYNRLVALVKSMLDYGAKAQTQFDRDQDNLANQDLVADDEGSPYYYDPAEVNETTIGDTGATDMIAADFSNYGLQYTGTTIVYLSETSIRHYFEITDQSKFDLVKGNITFGGDTPIEYKTKGNEIYFELKNVAAADLDTLYTLKIGDSEYQYSVLDYVKACLASDYTSANMKTLAAATYRYNQAANVYFGR